MFYKKIWKMLRFNQFTWSMIATSNHKREPVKTTSSLWSRQKTFNNLLTCCSHWCNNFDFWSYFSEAFVRGTSQRKESQKHHRHHSLVWYKVSERSDKKIRFVLEFSEFECHTFYSAFYDVSNTFVKANLLACEILYMFCRCFALFFLNTFQLDVINSIKPLK